MRWPDERDGELLDALMVAAAVLVRAPVGPGEPRVPAVFVELLDALDESRRMSESGHEVAAASTLDDVTAWVTANEAGRAAGMSGRQVRRLCGRGLVRHQVTDLGVLVDPADMARHLRERS